MRQNARFPRWEFGLGLLMLVAAFLLLSRNSTGFYLPALMALAWAWLLLGPCWPDQPAKTGLAVISPRLYRLLYLGLGPVFLLLCCLGELPGNSMLWLKVVYYLAFTCRLLYVLHFPLAGHWPRSAWLCFWSICALFPLVWSHGQISLHSFLYLLLLGLLWAITCTLLLALIKQSSVRNLLLVLLHSGPLPPLALAWPDIASWILAPLAIIMFLLRYGKTESSQERGVLWLPLWLFRAAFLGWWCLGCALCLTLAWWLPGHNLYFACNAWFKAIILGLFLMVCLGLLVEYSMPLLGRPEPEGYWRRDQSWGPILSALAMLLLLLPATLLPEPENAEPFPNKGWTVLLDQAVSLHPENQELELKLPENISSAQRVYVVSRLVNGHNLPQHQAVAMMTVMGESGLPVIYYLRAGIDTADQDLEQSRVLALARHEAAAGADGHLVFSDDGQAYYRKNYISGFFLQDPPENLRSITLRPAALDSFAVEEGKAPYLVLEKVMIE